MTRITSIARQIGAAGAVAVLTLATPTVAEAAYPSDTAPPDLVSLLSGYRAVWVPSGKRDLHGTVVDVTVARREDQLTVWMNGNATSAQRSGRCRTRRTRTPRAPPTTSP